MADTSKKRVDPGNCSVTLARLTNYAGEQIDITHLLEKLEIVESVFTLFASYEFTLVDGVALLEKYIITGNEKIELELTKRDNPKSEERVLKKLAVVGIKDYSKTSPESQVYVIQAIAESALLAVSMRTSKSVSGTIGTMIGELYNSIQYELPLNAIDDKTEGVHTVVLPNYTINDSIVLLLKKAQRTSGTVFHLFETLFHDTVLTSYEEIVARPKLDEYRQKSNEQTEKGTEDNFEENRTRIMSIDSNLGMSHFSNFMNGAITSTIHAVDIAQKTYETTTFAIHNEALPKLDKDLLVDPSYTIAGKSLSDLPNAVNHHVHRNTMAYKKDAIDNLSGKVDTSVAKRHAIVQNQFGINHTLTLNGDTRFRAGECIDIWVQQSTDPTNTSEHKDILLSGKFYIASVRHTINPGKDEYTCKLSVKKDSINIGAIVNKYSHLDG